MGSVALLGLGANGADRGTRALGVATIALLLVDPSLASAVGFALSVLATAGILLLAPAWRDALARWVPRWLAEASRCRRPRSWRAHRWWPRSPAQVSLVAVAANLLAAPAVGPATVLGLLGGLRDAGLAVRRSRSVGAAAGWCVAWIVEVAQRGAGLPTAAVAWGTGPVALAVLTVLCVVAAVLAPRLLARRATGAGLLRLMVLGRPGAPADSGLAPDRLDHGRLRRRAGRRARPQHRPRPHRRRRRRRPRPAPDEALSGRARGPAGPAGRADPLPRRPRRRPRRRARREARRRRVGDPAAGPARGGRRWCARRPAAAGVPTELAPYAQTRTDRRRHAGAGLAAARLADRRPG